MAYGKPTKPPEFRSQKDIKEIARLKRKIKQLEYTIEKATELLKMKEWKDDDYWKEL